MGQVVLLPKVFPIEDFEVLERVLFGKLLARESRVLTRRLLHLGDQNRVLQIIFSKLPREPVHVDDRNFLAGRVEQDLVDHSIGVTRVFVHSEKH